MAVLSGQPSPDKTLITSISLLNSLHTQQLPDNQLLQEIALVSIQRTYDDWYRGPLSWCYQLGRKEGLRCEELTGSVLILLEAQGSSHVTDETGDTSSFNISTTLMENKHMNLYNRRERGQGSFSSMPLWCKQPSDKTGRQSPSPPPFIMKTPDHLVQGSSTLSRADGHGTGT